MPHPPALLEKIAVKLERVYPKGAFTYLIEQRLAGSKRLIFPDIQVISDTGKIQCCVEVGYTRPEKIRLYHQMKIPDVRWYSKAGDHIHDNWTNTVHVRIDNPAKELLWHQVSLGRAIWYCPNCFESLYPEKSYSSDENYDDLVDAAIEEADCLDDVLIITNFSRVFAMVDCGGCGIYSCTSAHFLEMCLSAAELEDMDDLVALVSKKPAAEPADFRNLCDRLGISLKYHHCPKIDNRLLCIPSSHSDPTQAPIGGLHARSDTDTRS